jgi:tetratricopeptide (TPR) repeat protein
MLLSLVPLMVNFQRADHSRDSSLRDYLEDVAEVATPSGSLILMENVQAWTGALYLAKVEGMFPHAAFFSSYLAPLPWALPQFARAFPQVVIPEGLGAELKKHRAVLALDDVRRGPGVEDGLVYVEKELMGRALTADEKASYSSGIEKDPKGFFNQMLAEWVQRRLVEANLDKMPCYLALHRFDTPAPMWNSMHVEDRGMILGLHRQPVTGALPSVTFPSATEYAVDHISLPERRRLARRYASILNRFGILNIQHGAHREAEVCFLGALSRDPKYAVVHTNLGVLYEKHLHRPERAQEHYRRSVELDPEGPQAKAILEWLARQKPGS